MKAKAFSTILIFFLIFTLFALQEGEEFQVNTYTDGAQSGPATAVDWKGNFVITWSSYGQDGSDSGVFAKRFNNKGEAVGQEFQVNTHTLGWQNGPAIAKDKKGNFVITWASDGQDGSGWGIWAQRYNSQGKAVGQELYVATYSQANEPGLGIAKDKKGNFVITWADGSDGSGLGIFAQRFNSKGEAIGQEFQVNTYTLNWQYRSVIAMNWSGNFVITWTSDSGDGSGGTVFAQRYNSNGEAVGKEFQVNTHTDGTQTHPAIVMDKRGNFVIAWASRRLNSGWEIWAQRFNSAGKPVGREFKVTTFTGGANENPAIAMDKKGNFVITWASFGQNGLVWGIWAQRYNKRGKAIGKEFQVDNFKVGTKKYPAITVDKKGNFVVTWASDGPDGPDQEIYGKMYTK